MIIKIASKAGVFAENKDVAKNIREKSLLPSLRKKVKVYLDFDQVSGTTQSFVHALISEAIREFGDQVYDQMIFKNCTEQVQQIVNIVADYMQESVN